MAKKVGIMTLYYKTYNYGAQLQAYALQKVVERLGYECEQISFQWCNLDTERMYTGLGGVKPSNVESFKNFSGLIPHSKVIYSPDDIEKCVNDYDIFICGSDQIWGCTASMPRYVLPQITLSFVPEGKVKFSYGASMGGAETDTVTKNAIKHAISELDSVSVREQSSVPFVETMTDKPVTDVLDPTLLLNPEEWDEIAILPDKKQGYVLCYVIGDAAKVAEFTECAKAQGREVKSLAYSVENAISPQEFLGLIKKADLVLTNSFHGTVFSIVYKKEFFACGIDDIPSPYSKNIRITDLLNKLGLESRFINIKDMENALKTRTPIDYNSVGKALENGRQRSLDFLKTSLAIEKLEVDVPKNCCGCGVCSNLCSVDCITMQPDKLGFLYPKVDKTRCVECGACTKVCPVISPVRKPSNSGTSAYVAYYKNDKIRLRSSSGGLFSAFAEEVLVTGGVVFGAAYDSNMTVFQTFVERIEDLDTLRRSKYVQSYSGNTYREVEMFLMQGRQVLYCGVPCQIEALKVFLRKEYENLITIDLVCGGVTSPSLWEKYVSFKSAGKIDEINMRDRFYGYKARNAAFPSRIMGILFKTGDKEVFNGEDDLFLRASIDFYRDSCYNCSIKTVERVSDLTIGDYIGISFDTAGIDDNRGASIVLIQSEYGRRLFEKALPKLEYRPISLEEVTANKSMINSVLSPSACRDYLHSIFAESSIEKIYYEYKLFQHDQLLDISRRGYINEIIRVELMAKLTKYQLLGCSLDSDPDMKGKVLIYGAGKVGKLACNLFADKLIGFVDSFVNFESCNGYPVYRLESAEVKRLVEQNEQTTILVTVPWDFDKISKNIEEMYPEITNITSIEKAVEKICL